MEIKIYCLYDPVSCKIRYIGRTKCSLDKRLREHISKSKNYIKHFPNSQVPYKVNWLNSLIRKGIVPKIKLLTTVEGWSESHIVERQLINKYKGKFDLVNSEDRGEGHKNKNVSEETKQKIKNRLIDYYSKEENKTNFYNTVYVYNIDGKFYKEFESRIFVKQELNIPIEHITNMINTFDNNKGKRKPKYNYYFSKYKYDIFPNIANKKECDSHIEVKVVCKQTNEEKVFTNMLLFAKEFSLGHWDISTIKKKFTNKVSKLSLEYNIYLNNILLPL